MLALFTVCFFRRARTVDDESDGRVIGINGAYPGGLMEMRLRDGNRVGGDELLLLRLDFQPKDFAQRATGYFAQRYRHVSSSVVCDLVKALQPPFQLLIH